MKVDFEIQKVSDPIYDDTYFQVVGFVNGNFFGVIGDSHSYAEAEKIGKAFNPNPNDARVV